MLSIFYWVLLLLAFVLGAMGYKSSPNHYAFGGSLITWLLFLIVGLRLFGSPLG